MKGSYEMASYREDLCQSDLHCDCSFESTQTTELYISGSNVFTLLWVSVPELQHREAHF